MVRNYLQNLENSKFWVQDWRQKITLSKSGTPFTNRKLQLKTKKCEAVMHRAFNFHLSNFLSTSKQNFWVKDYEMFWLFSTSMCRLTCKINRFENFHSTKLMIIEPWTERVESYYYLKFESRATGNTGEKAQWDLWMSISSKQYLYRCKGLTLNGPLVRIRTS